MDKTQAESTLDAANQRDPRTAAAGVIIHDCMHLTLAFWFPSDAEALEAVPLMTGDPEGYQPGLGPLLGANASKLTDDLRVRINDVVKDEFQILWWGHFEDLCVADGEAQREMRSKYLETDEETGDDRPLLDDERAGFAEFLQALET